MQAHTEVPMQFVLVVLRMTHIVAGTFWAGSALMIAAVLLPGVSKAGPGAARALPMSSISKAMSVASLLTVLAGSALYVLIYRFEPNWIIECNRAGVHAWIAGRLGSLSAGPVAHWPHGAQGRRAGRPDASRRRAAFGRATGRDAAFAGRHEVQQHQQHDPDNGFVGAHVGGALPVIKPHQRPRPAIQR